MADNKKDITTEELPEPISREDALLHNIIDGTPDISDLEPLSREEVYLKYIALNGGSGGGDVNIVQTTGQSTTSVMSQKAVTDNLGTKVDIVEGKGLSTEDFTTEYKEKLDNIPNNLDNLGTAAYCDTGLSEGNVPILNSEGKLDNSVIPSLAITDTFVANSEEEMLNITGAEKGDICVRTDENKTYILDETPSRYRRSVSRTSLSDWIELQTPTDEVTSVNGQKGTVVITAEDIDTYTKTEIDGKLPNIVQTRGTSETDVMSQKAVTDELDKKIENTATGALGTSVGELSDASGSSSVAFGYLSTSSGNFSTAIGYNSKSEGHYATSIGYFSKVTVSNGTAIGESANVTSGFSVAIGAESKANEIKVVSFGSGDPNTVCPTRRIINVTDPINDQDAATKKYVDDKVAGSSSVTVVQTTGDSETDVMSQKAVSNNTCFGAGAQSSDGGTAVGKLSNAAGLNASAIGKGATATTSSSIAIGYNSSSISANEPGGVGAEIAIGKESLSKNGQTIAIGFQAEAISDSSITIGSQATTTSLQGVSLGAHSSCEGASSVALGRSSIASEDYVVSVGNDSITRKIVNVKDPVNNQDAATKNYVDSKVVVYDSTLTASGWTTVDTTTEVVPGSTHYIQQVNIAGIEESDNPLVYVVLSTATNTFSQEITEFSYVSKIVTHDGYIWATCLYNKPEINLNIRLVCFR